MIRKETGADIVLAFDPGDNTGWSRYDANKLVACGLVHPRDYDLLPEIVFGSFPERWTWRLTITIESQQVYRQSRQKSDPNNLISLAQKVGAIGMSLKQFFRTRYGVRLDPWETPSPAEWKGQRTKEICHSQMLPRLSEHERAVMMTHLLAIKSESQRQDVKDAVCLGLWRLKRAL